VGPGFHEGINNTQGHLCTKFQFLNLLPRLETYAWSWSSWPSLIASLCTPQHPLGLGLTPPLFGPGVDATEGSATATFPLGFPAT